MGDQYADMMKFGLLAPAEVDPSAVRLETSVQVFPNPITDLDFRLMDPNSEVVEGTLRLLTADGRVVPGLSPVSVVPTSFV